MPSVWADRIVARLPVAVVPSVPELRLHLAGPHSGLGRKLIRRAGSQPPYWAHVWGGGLILARYLFDQPAVVTGRSVIDLGTGSGLVAIAAARAGAARVTAIDVDPLAAAAARRNAALNGATIDVRCADLLEGPDPDVGLILVGDLFYDQALAERVTAFLDRCAERGRCILVGDPGRAALPHHRLQAIFTAPTPDFGVSRDGQVATVFRYVLG